MLIQGIDMLKIVKGDIWEVVKQSTTVRAKTVIVVPTNVGWKSNGDNVMGAGIAKDAAKFDPDFPRAYGRWCQLYCDRIFVHYSDPHGLHLCAAPSKPLNSATPHLSWQSSATYEQVVKSLGQLVNEARVRSHLDWYMPLLGVGNGRLDFNDVMKVTQECAWPDNVNLVLNVG